MSRLDDLIREHCPGGVPFKALGEVIRLNFGTRVTKMNDAGSAYPVYGGGGESFRVDRFNREDEYVVSRFALSAKCVRKVSGRFWLLDSGFTFDVLDDSIDKDYVGHLLFNMQPQIYACTSEGAQKNLKTDEFRQFRVPVPPLGVQREIVRILDHFTELEAELEAGLEAELEARLLQYAYLRDSLLGGVTIDSTWRPMGEVGEFTRGRRFTRADIHNGGIPSIHYGEIYTHYGVAASTSVRQVREELRAQLRFALPGDVVIASVGETVEDVGKAVAWLGYEPVAIHDDTFGFRHSLNPKFVSYWMQTEAFHSQKTRHVASAKIKRLSSSALASILMPAPPMDEQERVVEILDKFDALVNDLSIGLPAELAARRKQYEYYRDKLLTFEEQV